ncbi:S-ribosylhomocysteine lyase [Paenibacillus filicis]|uniref:S-ribosylhomocysteine lyase n=1 Tax=Paenibacillus filicis TaxID=669464 RepID=A0ABU9DNF3_9BACL
MTDQTNVESFQLDHTKVSAPYVRLAGIKKGQHGDEVYKYDVRFCQPNEEHMEMPDLHSLEHLIAEHIRNHTDQVVDFSPMGCQTGFYLTVINHQDYNDVLRILERTLEDVLQAEAVPACNVVQCGWAASHSLSGAKALASGMLERRAEWPQVWKQAE